MSSRNGLATMCACCLLPFYLSIMIVFLVVPVLFIVVGIIKFHDCQADSRIPIWMISIAAVILLERILETVKNIGDRKFIRENPKPEGEDAVDEWEKQKKENQSTCLMVLLFFVRTAVFCGTIVGSVFVFSIFEKRDKCDGLVFWSSFVYCVLSISIYALVILLVACLCCLLALNITISS
ncbi:hypothetical protein GCK72_002546 [Caenorhabditis remanei]|uniref:Uncharacterized protein n=1 Tax=Caenorhabditis remanei TaxID=31234 RepID=A0A6A5HVI9_CAERE|nr:hypothetical protein GCK72_002546 [Caenorhabditis remanei]KAF1770724.1 hypothetical protein GCK72_002546 [Caenorhabditis remanei]